MKKLKLRVKWKEASLEDFVAKHADDFTADDFFLQTASPLSAGTEVAFEFLLAGGRSFFEGRGVVADARSHDGRPGMTIRHTELSVAASDLLQALSPPVWEDHTPIFPVNSELIDSGDHDDEDTATGLEDEVRR